MLRSLFFLLVAGLFTTCQSSDPLLERLDNAAIGIDFNNQLTESTEMHPLRFEYIYNGAGVGVGDFDGNGLPDLYFSGNMVSGELYLQKEPWVFERVTASAGLETAGWVTGVNVHDVDGNGYEDIYLTTLHPQQEPSANLLYLNDGPGPDGVPRFREVAAEYGVDHPGFGTHSAWLDLEGDGDLDLYVLNNAIEVSSRKDLRGADTSGTARSMDAIYRNPGNGKLPFVRDSQLRLEGWGLGLVASDFNHDGATDLYIANDFWSDDHYFLNDGSGYLRQARQDAFAHTSRNSMGVDAADLNNDGLLDVMTVDMLPNTNTRQKTMFGDIPHGIDQRAYLNGYGRQYVRNALQINNGDGSYSDLAFQTGTADTDWSWTPLLADFNNDGYRDVFISNGYPKDITNRDFIDFSQNGAMFGTREEIDRKVNEALLAAGGVHQPNMIYQNGPDLTFKVSNWIADEPTYSNGAVYVDLDLDGDLDLVTNNINEPAGVYRNHARERYPEQSNYLQLQFDGPSGNPDGLGTKVYVWSSNGNFSYAEQQRQRGYLGTVGATLHFGLGEVAQVDSLLIVWPGGRWQRLAAVQANQRLTVQYQEAESTTLAPPNYAITFTNGTAPATSTGPKLNLIPLPNLPKHHESSYTDFDRYALAVRDLSKSGPVMATTGTGSNQKLAFSNGYGRGISIYHYAQKGFEPSQTLAADEAGEVTALRFFDYDGDGDDDLYVGYGSDEASPEDALYIDRLFRNDGGKWVLTQGMIPEIPALTAAIASADLEGDGDLDIFVGVRHALGEYPRSAESYVLENDGEKFRIRQKLDLGLVTDAAWQVLATNEPARLIVTADYAVPQIGTFANGELRFQPLADVGKGWWYGVTPGDLDGDGDTDLLLGNLGLNAGYRADRDRPLTVRVQDYDNNGTLDPIMMQYNGERSHPVHPRNTLGRQLPALKKQRTSYAEYGGWAAENMPPLDESGFQLEANDFRSYYLRNDGGSFTAFPLSPMGQTAPIRDALLHKTSAGTCFLAVQNDYAFEVLFGRMDAGTGLAIRVDEFGRPIVDPGYWSVRDDARSVVQLGDKILVGVNDGEARLYGPATEATVQPSR